MYQQSPVLKKKIIDYLNTLNDALKVYDHSLPAMQIISVAFADLTVQSVWPILTILLVMFKASNDEPLILIILSFSFTLETTGVIDSSQANVQSPEQIDGMPLITTDTLDIFKKYQA
jgi:hypothetical protein